MSLRVDCGASQNDLDLTDLKVTDLTLKTGASGTMVRLPREAGLTNVRVEAGAASVRLKVPDGVAARIRTEMGLGSNAIDTRRFLLTGEGYASSDFDSAPHRVDIKFAGGVGSFAVE